MEPSEAMLKSFKIKTYDEDTGYGLLRHVLIRRGITQRVEIMVVLVTASPVFPSKNNFSTGIERKAPGNYDDCSECKRQGHQYGTR